MKHVDQKAPQPGLFKRLASLFTGNPTRRLAPRGVSKHREQRHPAGLKERKKRRRQLSAASKRRNR